MMRVMVTIELSCYVCENRAILTPYCIMKATITAESYHDCIRQAELQRWTINQFTGRCWCSTHNPYGVKP